MEAYSGDDNWIERDGCEKVVNGEWYQEGWVVDWGAWFYKLAS